MYAQRESHYGKEEQRKETEKGKPFLTFPERLSLSGFTLSGFPFRMHTFF